MKDIDFLRVRAIFLAARDLDHVARMDVLHRECEADAALRVEVESLLFYHDSARGHATTPVVGHAAQLIFEAAESVDQPLPRSFGEFELLEVIGRGGMGTVYRARQRTPDRTVALKMIRPGMLSRTMLGRFRYEADILARLHHPGVAQIFEAGTAQSGDVEQPYVALELVSGQPVDRYATDHRLDVRGKVNILIMVCDAVHHAHQKGVIHRDLKPANILVSAGGQPKVLDFGVARLTDADVRETTLRTDVGQLIGTLPYMSPEQVSGDTRCLDIRSDVYALGVLIFELLTGRLPYDLHEKALADAAITIRNTEPLRLSAIMPALRGDLDTIMAKTLEKDPARRYQSAAALAEDLRRYLAHQPIIARPASVTYQIRLFARRHRALVAAGALGISALVLATGISVGSAVQARRAASREAAQRNIAVRTNEHLERMLTLPDPHRAGPAMTVAEMLDLMTQSLDGGTELPEVEARVRTAIGRTYLNLRRTNDATEQLGRAVELWRTIDPSGLQFAQTLVSLGTARLQLGDGEGGESAYREAMSILERLGASDDLGVRSDLVTMLLRRGKYAEAEPIARDLLRAARRQGDPVVIIAELRQLTQIDSGLGFHEEALDNLVEARALAVRHLDETHPMYNGVLLDLSIARRAQGDLEGALEASWEAYELAQRVRKPGSYDWMVCTNVHLSVLEALDRRAEIVDVLRRARESFLTTYGPDHRFVRETDGQLLDLQDRWARQDAQSVLGKDEEIIAVPFAAEPKP